MLERRPGRRQMLIEEHLGGLTQDPITTRALLVNATAQREAIGALDCLIDRMHRFGILPFLQVLKRLLDEADEGIEVSGARDAAAAETFRMR